MALRTLILAANPREGGHYAKRAGLQRWTYRVVHGAGQVRGLPYAGLEVHILPSFDRMMNRGSILSALRHKRGIEYFYVDPDDMPTLAELESQAQADELGDLTDEQLDVAYDANSHFDHAGWDAAQRRARLDAMTDDELADLMTSGPSAAEAPQIVDAIKAKPKPRKPRQAPPTPPVDTSAYFAAED